MELLWKPLKSFSPAQLRLLLCEQPIWQLFLQGQDGPRLKRSVRAIHARLDRAALLLRDQAEEWLAKLDFDGLFPVNLQNSVSERKRRNWWTCVDHEAGWHLVWEVLFAVLWTDDGVLEALIRKESFVGEWFVLAGKWCKFELGVKNGLDLPCRKKENCSQPDRPPEHDSTLSHCDHQRPQ